MVYAYPKLEYHTIHYIIVKEEKTRCSMKVKNYSRNI